MASNQITIANLYAVKGSSKDFTFIVTNGGVIPVDYTGATSITMTVKQKISDTDALFTLTATDGVNGTDLNAVAGATLVFRMTATNAALLTPNCVYDVKLTPSGLTARAIVAGEIVVRLNVG